MNQAVTKTVSEVLFESFCRESEIPFTRVEETEDRRPDYEIVLAGHRVVVEVKQFDANKGEAETVRRMEAGGVCVTGGEPGDRIRNAIRKGAPQLRALSKGERPAMLVVYNNVRSSKRHTDPYAVATAMQGLDVVPVLVSGDPSVRPEFQDVRSGPGKKMTETANTTISAIGVLQTDADGAPDLYVYHNRYARNPIEADWLRSTQARHFRLPESGASSTAGWDEL